jgi:feruloyl esterase
MKTPLVAAALLASVGLGSPRLDHVRVAPTPCEQLTSLKLENTVIASVERVTRGTFNVPESADSVTRLPAFCRVVGELRPTTDSHIAFELWLPLDTWNGKFAGVGNGGWAGIISYSALGEQLRRGYATVSTNTGHVAEPDSIWRSLHSDILSAWRISAGGRCTR